MNFPLGSATGLLERSHFLGENIQGNGRVHSSLCRKGQINCKEGNIFFTSPVGEVINIFFTSTGSSRRDNKYLFTSSFQ